jgi:hypothetical protein
MKNNLKILIIAILMGMSYLSFSQQIDEIKLNPERVRMFFPYVEWKHGGAQGFPAWKSSNKMLYAQEMWYYSESFYVKRNVSNEGQVLDESIIDITRLESKRKQDEEVTVNLPGFKDAIVLIPGNKLIYKP